MLTAQKLYQEQAYAPADKPEQKVSNKAKKKYAYGIHKLFALAVSFSFVLAILLLAEHALVITTAYKIISLNKEITTLKTGNDRLQLNIAQAKALNRVEYVAKTKLSMVRPDENSTEFMDIGPALDTLHQKEAIITVKKMPGKKINLVVETLNNVFKGWFTQVSASEINPKG